METKSNYLMVGAITLLLVALLAAFTVWLSRAGEGGKKKYDIFFQQSVNGLAKGSGVSFSGVPVGEIQSIELWEPDPEFVRVRITIKDSVPVLLGTTATINGVGFTGVSEIQLDGAVKGAPALVCPEANPKSACPTGVPVIPTKPGALGELLNNAPLLLERLSALTERLTNILSDKNQQSIEQILDNVENLSGTLATQGPDLRATIQESRIALQKAGLAADEITKMAGTTNKLLDSDGRPMLVELRKTLRSANGSLAALETTLNNANPAIETLNTQTLPEVTQLARDLRELSVSLKSVTDKVDQGGIGSVVNAPALPDYQPGSRKQK
jgi:phospholipid/cholesterol/gamma-HCH transport system substrate-binding protein